MKCLAQGCPAYQMGLNPHFHSMCSTLPPAKILVSWQTQTMLLVMELCPLLFWGFSFYFIFLR